MHNLGTIFGVVIMALNELMERIRNILYYHMTKFANLVIKY